LRKYFSLATGILALGTEALVFLSLMELPPFGKGGSDIIWALPFFGLVVVGLSTVGIRAAIRANSNPSHAGKVVVAGFIRQHAESRHSNSVVAVRCREGRVSFVAFSRVRCAFAVTLGRNRRR